MSFKIVLPKAEVNEEMLKKTVEAFSKRFGNENVSVATKPDKVPDYYYYSEMADDCMDSPETLVAYVDGYHDVCAALLREMPEERELWEYLEYSFYIFSVREIHTRERAEQYRKVLDVLEKRIDEHRSSFDENRFPSRFEKRWCNRYVTVGANFNQAFLLPVTLRCNKRCKYCMTFCPYLEIEKRAYHPSFDFLCRQIDKLFETIDNSYGLQFAGGEPCIRNDLPDLIDYVGEHYKGRICDYTRQGTGFTIITNSSIDFSDRLIEASKRFGPKLCWLLDDYHFSIADKIVEKLEANGIDYVRRDQKTKGQIHCDGWINPLNDFSLPTDSQKAIAAASRCGQKQLILQLLVANGRIYPCSRVMASDVYWPNMQVSKEYSIDLFDDTMSKEEKVSQMKKLLCANYFHTCDKCKGIYEGRKRLYPATQLTTEEYAALKVGEISMTDFGNYDE